jgi:hypothetical protein
MSAHDQLVNVFDVLDHFERWRAVSAPPAECLRNRLTETKSDCAALVAPLNHERKPPEPQEKGRDRTADLNASRPQLPRRWRSHTTSG